jgi:hypothetical protein
MTKLLFASLLAAAVVFAQDTGGTKDQKTPKTIESPTGKKGKTHSKTAGKKAVKEKGKKGSGGTTTPPPK